MANSFLIMMFQGKIGLGNDLGAVVSLHLEAPRVLSQLHIMLFRHQLSLETFSHKIVLALNFVLNHLTRPRLSRIPIVGKNAFGAAADIYQQRSLFQVISSINDFTHF